MGKMPIYQNDIPSIEERVFNENMMVFLDKRNTTNSIERFGSEKIDKWYLTEETILTSIRKLKGQYGSIRYIIRDSKFDYISVIHCVTKNKLCCISNMCTRPDYRNQGLFKTLLKKINEEHKTVCVSRYLSVSGASVLGITKQRFSYNFIDNGS